MSEYWEDSTGLEEAMRVISLHRERPAEFAELEDAMHFSQFEGVHPSHIIAYALIKTLIGTRTEPSEVLYRTDIWRKHHQD